MAKVTKTHVYMILLRYYIATIEDVEAIADFITVVCSNISTTSQVKPSNLQSVIIRGVSPTGLLLNCLILFSVPRLKTELVPIATKYTIFSLTLSDLSLFLVAL